MEAPYPSRVPSSHGHEEGEPPDVPNPREPTPVHPLLMPTVMLAPARSRDALELPTAGEPAPNPQGNLFPRAESLRESRAFPGGSNQQLMGSSTARGWHSAVCRRPSQQQARDKEQSVPGTCHGAEPSLFAPHPSGPPLAV